MVHTSVPESTTDKKQKLSLRASTTRVIKVFRLELNQTNDYLVQAYNKVVVLLSKSSVLFGLIVVTVIAIIGYASMHFLGKFLFENG